MPIIEIAGQRIQVDDSFDRLSAEQQNVTVNEIAASLGIGPAQAAPKPPPERGLGGLFTGGVSRGASQMGILLGDYLPAMAGRAVGADEYAARQLAEAKASEEKLARENPASYKSYEDVKGIWDAIRFGTESIGEALPSMLTPLGVTGGVASGVGRYAATRALKAGAEQMAAKQAGQAAAKSALIPTVTATSVAQTVPEAYADILRETGQEHIGAALVAGGVNAALESVLPASIFRGLGKEARDALTGNIAARVAGGVVSGAVTEGLTEGAQEAINKLASSYVDRNKEFFTSENWKGILNSSIKGAIAGGAFKGAAGIPGPARPPSPGEELAADAAEIKASVPGYRADIAEREAAAKELATAEDARVQGASDIKAGEAGQIAEMEAARAAEGAEAALKSYAPPDVLALPAPESGTITHATDDSVITGIRSGRGPSGRFIRNAPPGTEFIAGEVPGGFAVRGKDGAVYTAPMSTLDAAKRAANAATEVQNIRAQEAAAEEAAAIKLADREALLSAAKETTTPTRIPLESLPPALAGLVRMRRTQGLGEKNVEALVSRDELRDAGVPAQDIQSFSAAVKPVTEGTGRVAAGRQAAPAPTPLPLPYPDGAPLPKVPAPSPAQAQPVDETEFGQAPELVGDTEPPVGPTLGPEAAVDEVQSLIDAVARGESIGAGLAGLPKAPTKVAVSRKLKKLAKQEGVEVTKDDTNETIFQKLKNKRSAPVETVSPKEKSNSRLIIDQRLADLESRGEQGKVSAESVRAALNDATFTPDQIVMAFQAADVATGLLGKTGEVVQIKFLSEILGPGGVKAAGRYTPRGPGAFTGMIELSLDPNLLGQGVETSAHEAFHVMQRLFSEFDPKSAGIVESAFKGAKNIDGIDGGLLNILKANKALDTNTSYYKILKDMAPQFETMDQATRERELSAHTFGALYEMTVKGRKTVPLATGYRRFLNFFSAFFARMGNFLRDNGFRSASDVMRDVVAGKGTGAIAGKSATAPDIMGPVQPQYSMAQARGTSMGQAPQQAAQGAAGSARYGQVWTALSKAFNPLHGVDNIERYFKLRNWMHGRTGKSEARAQELSKAIAKGTPAERDTINKFLTTKGASPAMIADPAMRAAAVQTKQEINNLADEMVRQKFATQKGMDEHYGGYLPQLYLKFEAMGKGIKTPNMGLSMQEYLKKRVNLSEDEKKMMGLITDPAYLSYIALSRPSHDLAMAEFFEGIATETGVKWTLPQSTVKWMGRKVGAYHLTQEANTMRTIADLTPDPAVAKLMRDRAKQADALAKTIPGTPSDMQGYKELPDSHRYGVLRKVPVQTSIYNDLVGQFGTGNQENRSTAEKLIGENSVLGKTHQLWKLSKVVFNIPSQVRNATSNLIALHLFAGVPMHQLPRYISMSVGEMVNKGKFYQEAVNWGIKGGTMSQAELKGIQKQLEDYLRVNKGGGLLSSYGLARILAGAGEKTLRVGTGIYETSETVFKLAAFIHARENGKNPSQAVDAANEALFDYSLVPPSMRYMRTHPFGLPFITYQYKVLPQLLKTLKEHPMRFAPYVALSYALPQLAMAAFDFSDEDLDKLQKSLPEYARTKGSVYFLPIKDEKGNPMWVDVGAFFPWGSLFDPIKQAAIMGDPAGGAKELAKIITPGGPAVAALVGGVAGLDPFTLRPIADPKQTAYNQMLSRLSWIGNQALPPMLSFDPINPDNSYGAVHKLYNSIFSDGTGLDKKGKPKEDVIGALTALAGFNMKSLDPARQPADNIKSMEYKMNARKTLINQIGKDQSLTLEQKRSQIADIVEAIKEDAAELRDYARSTSGVRKP